MSVGDGQAQALSKDHTPLEDYERLGKIANRAEHKEMRKVFRINARDESKEDLEKLSMAEREKSPFIAKGPGLPGKVTSRLMGTIGVARAFGDFALSVFGVRELKIKPFLTAEPFVKIEMLRESEVGATDVLCIACDGVFDVMSDQEVVDT